MWAGGGRILGAPPNFYSNSHVKGDSFKGMWWRVDRDSLEQVQGEGARGPPGDNDHQDSWRENLVLKRNLEVIHI